MAKHFTTPQLHTVTVTAFGIFMALDEIWWACAVLHRPGPLRIRVLCGMTGMAEVHYRYWGRAVPRHILGTFARRVAAPIAHFPFY